VVVLENNLQIPISELEEQRPGVQFVIAITPGDTFSIRDVEGVSRYEYLLQGLLAGTWTNQRAGVDDLSLLTMGGPQVTHSSDPKELATSLEAYFVDDQQTVPSLEVLASAVQVVSDPTDRPGMEKAILFITPPQANEVSLGLQSIISNARQQDIHVFVWMVGSQEVFDLPEVEMLRNLASQTQGTFFAFSHDESVPDLESILEPLRSIYYLGYNSQIKSAGFQQLAAQVTVGSEQVTTEAISFEVSLLAPVLMLKDFPEEIVRTYEHQPTPGSSSIDANLIPAKQVINLQVEFPDGYDRPLARTALYIDGVLNSENTNPPFDQFVWDLMPYTQDGIHIIKVEAVDNLGISGSTEEASVNIIVPQPAQGMMVVLSQKRLLLAGLVILISASLLLLALILAGRIRPKPHPGQVRSLPGSNEKTRPAGYRAHIHQRRDLATQPAKKTSLPPTQSTARARTWKDWLPWYKSEPVPEPAIAYLIPLTGSDEPTLPAPLPVVAGGATIGRDPSQVDLVIQDPSLESYHAHIRQEGASFIIADAGSVAGTWVNYKPVPPEGTPLEHAAIIHLGRIGLRFTLSKPGQLREIVVTPLEPEA
jgi:hypothetical protein